MTIQSKEQAQARLGEIETESMQIIEKAEGEQGGRFTSEQRDSFDALIAERDQLRSDFGISRSDALDESRGRKTKPMQPAPASGVWNPGGSARIETPSTGRIGAHFEDVFPNAARDRSEERRVGKEC